jgi:hypothetical protein
MDQTFLLKVAMETTLYFQTLIELIPVGIADGQKDFTDPDPVTLDVIDL